MPQDYGFPWSRVNTFMSDTFDYLLTETDFSVGDPNDGHRLVQRFSWYSTSDTTFNGWLFDPDSGEPTESGQHLAAYTAQIAEAIDLSPVRVFAQPAAPFSHGENVTFTLKALVTNSGNVSSTHSVAVQFFDGDPSAGGVQIGTDQILPPLPGCGGNGVAQVEWTGVAPGAHQVYAVVDSGKAVPESDEMNNVANQTILVATHQAFLAAIYRGSD
jgi:hypothetical protein